MKRKAFLVLVWFIINPIYGQINFNEKINIYDIDSLSINIIYDDFDNDGDLDFVKYIPYNQRNVLLQKNENGNLNLKVPKFISSGDSPIISLDINNDNYPDLITYHSFNTIGVMHNLQNDTFSAEQTLINFSGSYTISPIKFDYNNDGFIDLIVKDNQNNAYVLMNNQNGDFMPQQFLFPLGYSSSIYKIDDFDNDGDFDLYVLDSTLLKIILNNGNYANPNILNVPAGPLKEYGILDIDGNGYKDILYWKNDAIWAKSFGLNTSTNQLIILNDLPVVQNIPFQTYSNNDRSIYIKHINAGNYDVYVALESTPNQYNIHKFNISNGTFSSSEVVLSNFDINIFTLNNFEFLDLNNNGDIDFSFSSNFNQQNMLFVNYDIDNLSDKTICIQQAITPTNFNVIDMNGDGIEDICIGQHNGLGYYEKMINNEQGTLKNLLGVMSNPNASTYTINHIVDFDNDGIGDVIDYNTSGMYIKVYKNLGNDNFLSVQNLSIPILTTGFYFEDIDNDGFKDILFKKNYYSAVNEILWAKNNNGINFANVQPFTFSYPNIINTIDYASGDVNNNGTTDILILNAYNSSGITNFEIILLENQNGIFTATNIDTLLDYYIEGKIKIKDIDQDGDLDFFVYDFNEKPFLFYRNDGQNNFVKIIIENIKIHDIDFDDNDGDGKHEIYAINYNSSAYTSNVFYYKTLDFVNFTKFNIDSFGSYDDVRADILLFDYNGDNKKDLFINSPSFFKGLVSVYINSSNTLTIEEVSNNINNNLKIFPNPFTNFINLNSENNNNYKLQLFSLNGKLIYEVRTLDNKIDLSFLECGTYLLVVENTDLNSKNSYKIIKK